MKYVFDGKMYCEKFYLAKSLAESDCSWLGTYNSKIKLIVYLDFGGGKKTSIS